MSFHYLARSVITAHINIIRTEVDLMICVVAASIAPSVCGLTIFTFKGID